MYLSYFKLNKKPFQISTDPKFLWLGKKHQEALSILKYGIEDDKGFLLLTGDVGTGKTTLINAFVNSLEDDVIVARISDPGLTKLDFIKYVAQKFNMDTDFQTKSEFLTQFTAFLEKSDADHKKVLLIIDEAQHLTDEILEEIRLLSNIENQDKKLLNIFLVGQDEFNATLEKHKNRALRQRITINYTLYPLEKEETKTCIEYRLGVAGCHKELFTPEAIHAIHTLSEGFPRVINIVCDHALFRGCQDNQEKITDEMIWEISKNLRFAHIPQPLKEPDFSSSTDADWLEASEVPPLSIEEINKASQPLPEFTSEITEEPQRRSHKYRVAIPIFIIAFLLSGFFVLDETKINAITQFIADRYKETIASTLKEVTTEQSPQEVPIESEALPPTKPETSTKAPAEIVHLSNQKKSLPEDPEPAVSQNQVEQVAPASAENIESTEIQQAEIPKPQELEKITEIIEEQPQVIEQELLAPTAVVPEDIDVSRSEGKIPASNTAHPETEIAEHGGREDGQSISDTDQKDLPSNKRIVTRDRKSVV